jgi:hypothetical protein
VRAKPIFLFSLLLLVLLGCHKKKKHTGEPATSPIISVSSFTATPITIDFLAKTDGVFFNASFTTIVTWVLTIKGNQSGAVHTISGTGESLTNIEWKGDHDYWLFFSAGETVTATLSFPTNPATVSLDLNIVNVPNYAMSGSQKALYGDFETPSKVLPIPPSTYSAYWASFNFPNSIPNESQGIDSIALDYTGNAVPSIQGKNYYYIKGLGAQAQFVSGLQYFGALSPALPATPENIWVNLYVYGTGDANAALDLEYQESDIDGSTPGYQGEDDDAWVTHLTLNHKGWKLLSFKYSDLVPSANKDFGGSGNKIYEPNRLVSFDFIVLKKSNPNAPVEVYFDYPIITVGGPFKP